MFIALSCSFYSLVLIVKGPYYTIKFQVKLMNDEGAKQWTLVLPPWGRIYHWKSDIYQRQVSWNRFFDIESLNRHVPVMELKDWMKGDLHHILTIALHDLIVHIRIF